MCGCGKNKSDAHLSSPRAERFDLECGGPLHVHQRDALVLDLVDGGKDRNEKQFIERNEKKREKNVMSSFV